MTTETEIKLSLPSTNFEQILYICRSIYSSESEAAKEVDEYYDTAQQSLRSQDYTVRLRLGSGGARLALKSPRVFLDDQVHTRIELEFTVRDEHEVREELKGMSAVAVIEKQRWTFRTQEGSIVLDKLPFIGAFIEIEASNPTHINDVLQALQLGRNSATRDNYTELLEAKMVELGLPGRPRLKATFDYEEQFLAGIGVLERG